jgi:hypothetical protein
MKLVAALALVVAVVLGGVGGYRIADEHESLYRLRGMQGIMRDLNQDAERIVAESNTSLGQAIAMSTANMAQSQVNEYLEAIALHEARQRVGYVFLVGSVGFLVLGYTLFRKSGRVRTSEDNVDEVTIQQYKKHKESIAQEANAEGGEIEHEDVATSVEPKKRPSEFGYPLGFLAFIVVGAIWYVIHIGAAQKNTPPTSHPVATVPSTTSFVTPPKVSSWHVGAATFNAMDGSKLQFISTGSSVRLKVPRVV